MTENKIGIAGIGNLLLEDEGFGVHLVQNLLTNYEFPDNVEIQDVGTAGIYMAPFLEECDPVFVVDVVDIDGEPGSSHHFHLADIKTGKFSTRMSPHQIGLLEIIEVSKLRDAAPERVEFFTIVPYSLTETVELSEIAAKQLESVTTMILDKLTELGVKYTKKDS